MVTALPPATTDVALVPESSALRQFRPRQKRRILVAFPRYSYSFGTLQPRLSAHGRREGIHAAPRHSGRHRADSGGVGSGLRGREHPARHPGRVRLGGRGFRFRHAHPARPHSRSDPARARRGQGGRARRPVGFVRAGILSRRGSAPLRRGRRRHPAALPAPRRNGGAAGGAACLPHGREAPDVGLPHAGLRPHRYSRVPARLGAVLQRLSVHLRVLRHPRPVWPQPAPENAGAGGARAGPARRRRVCLGLFCRRQLHRQPEGGRVAAGRLDRMAEAARLPGAAGLRGDPEHGRPHAHPGKDAGGVFHQLLFSASRRPTRRRSS